MWFFATAGMQPGDGCMAELCCVPDVDVVPLDATASRTTLAAAVGLSGVAAWMALSWRARLKPASGCWCSAAVVRSARSGSVRAGARGLGGRGDGAPDVGRDRATAAGADVVVPLEGEVDALAAALAEHGPFDVVLDPVFGVGRRRPPRGTWPSTGAW